MKIQKIALSTLLISSLFLGCTQTPEPTPEDQKQIAQFDIKDIDTFQTELTDTIDDENLMFYAPISASKAISSYEDAKSSKDKTEKYLSFQTVKKALKKALQTKELVLKNFDEIIIYQEKMIEVNVKFAFPDRYVDLLDNFSTLIKEIDNDDLPSALKEKPELLNEAKELYGDTIVYNNLQRVEEVMENIKLNKLDLQAPKHFEKLETLYEKSKQEIKQDPDNNEKVLKVATEVFNLALFTQVIANDVLKLKTVDVENYENYIEDMHKTIAKLTPKDLPYSLLQLSLEKKMQEIKLIYSERESHLKAQLNVLNIKLNKAQEDIKGLQKSCSLKESNSSLATKKK